MKQVSRLGVLKLVLDGHCHQLALRKDKEGKTAQMVLNVSLIKLMNVWEAPEKQMQQKKMKANVIKP